VLVLGGEDGKFVLEGVVGVLGVGVRVEERMRAYLVKGLGGEGTVLEFLDDV
jgi:hypothetical protein